MLAAAKPAGVPAGVPDGVSAKQGADVSAHVSSSHGDEATQTMQTITWLKEAGSHAGVRNIWHHHGFSALNKLLKAADALHVACQDQIVDVACDAVEKLDTLGDHDQRAAVYAKLLRLPDFPPVGLDWFNVAKLCGLCVVMPAIIECQLGMAFFDRLCHKVKELYLLPGNRLSTSKELLNSIACKYDADAMINTTRLIVIKCNDMLHLVQLRPDQDCVRDCNQDELANFDVLTTTAWVPNKTRSVTVSSSNKYILWCELKNRLSDITEWPTPTKHIEDPEARTSVIVFDVEKHQVVDIHPYFAGMLTAWWAGPDILGLRSPFSVGWQTIHVSQLSAPHTMPKTHFGRFGAYSSRAVLGGLRNPNYKNTEMYFQYADQTNMRWHSHSITEGIERIAEDSTDASGRTFFLFDKSNNAWRMHFDVDDINETKVNTTCASISASAVDKALAKLAWTKQKAV